MLELARTAVRGGGRRRRAAPRGHARVELAEPAALIYCPSRSLLHLPTWADRRLVFERVAAALRPGGRFAWNSFVFSPHVAARNDGVHEGRTGSGARPPPPPRQPARHVLDAGGGTSLWWVTRSEWEGLLEVAGLEVESLHGWFDGTPFAEDAREFVWVARKPS